jgi:hypothetical protein
MSGEFLIYQTDEGRVKLQVRLENETLWLTQAMMAELFQTSKQNIGQHLKNIFDEGELNADSVVKNFFTTAADGKQYSTRFYNLDAIISVGYRVKNSPNGGADTKNCKARTTPCATWKRRRGYWKRKNNLFQNVALSHLRDTLLPKLISGELRVLEATKKTEAGL